MYCWNYINFSRFSLRSVLLRDVTIYIFFTEAILDFLFHWVFHIYDHLVSVHHIILSHFYSHLPLRHIQRICLTPKLVRKSFFQKALNVHKLVTIKRQNERVVLTSSSETSSSSLENFRHST